MRLLDLFCGAGGAAWGYHLAGFDEIVGVDVAPQPNYPFTFVQADALTYPLDGFDLIHASPPCQAYSAITRVSRSRGAQRNHPDLVGPVRDRLLGSAAPFVVENVPGAPLRNPVRLCGSHFGLAVRRHRLFETSFACGAPPTCHHSRRCVAVYGKRPGDRLPDGVQRAASAAAAADAMGIPRTIGVYGHRGGRSNGLNGRAYVGNLQEAAADMEIPWMTWRELTQAIPPAYTRWIAERFLKRTAPGSSC